MSEPGLDLHVHETRYAELDDELREDPRAALPELLALVGDMLRERGYEPEAAEPEIVAEYRAARDVAVRVERGEDDDPGDVADAIFSLRALYRTLAGEYPEPTQPVSPD
jgi:hypothetical protein